MFRLFAAFSAALLFLVSSRASAQPDLIVQNIVKQGNTVLVKVANKGRSTARPTRLRLVIARRGANSLSLLRPVPALAPNQGKVIPVALPPMPTGRSGAAQQKLFAKAKADAFNQLPESNEQNNTMSKVLP